MSKDNKLQLLSPLFLKYQTEFEKNPRSRVFAPLAETYRKLGMTDKAMEILSQGIRFHPSYVMGYLGLAFCYFDLKQFNLAYSTLHPHVENNRDNLRLLKLYSDICLALGKQEEALETLKYLLFINPRDKEVAEMVVSLERSVEERYRPQHKPIIIPEKEFTSENDNSSESSLFNLDKLDSSKAPHKGDFDDWMTVDLSHESKAEVKTDLTSAPQTKVDYDQWNVKKVDQTFEDEPFEINNFVQKNEQAKESKTEDRSFKVHLNLDDDHDENHSHQKEEPKKEHKEQPRNYQSEAPLVTHTLVDLYCGQGHMEKALEVLEKILILNPHDQRTIKKIQEIKALTQPFDQYDEEAEEDNEKPVHATHLVDLSEVEDVSEEDGRRNLMNLIDEKLGPIEITETEEDNKFEVSRLVEEKLSLFLKKIQKRALDYQGRV